MTFHDRAAWGARSPKSTASKITSAGQKLHYNGPPMQSIVSRHDRCAAAVRAIQSYHMNNNGWADIAYSYLVCPHGDVYQGRGAGRRTAANGTNVCNGRYEAVMVMIGDGQELSGPAKAGAWEAIDRCREAGAGLHIGVHSDCKATSCPGSSIRGWVAAGAPLSGGPAPAPAPTPTPSPPASDWFEEVIGVLATLDFRPAGPGSLVRHHLVDNVQGLLAGARINPGPIDGLGGRQTRDAVLAFQRKVGIADDAIVGPTTWRRLITY